MDVLLRLNIVPFSEVSGTAQSILASIELSGPALLTESSSSLMTTILQERVKENPTHFSSTAERILNWLLGKWTPSRCYHTFSRIQLRIFKVHGLSEYTLRWLRTTAMLAMCYVLSTPVLT